MEVQMDIETVIIAALVFAMGSVAAKAFQRRKDVLYGPYIASSFQQRWHHIADEMRRA